MSLRNSKCWYSNNSLQFLKHSFPLPHVVRKMTERELLNFKVRSTLLYWEVEIGKTFTWSFLRQTLAFTSSLMRLFFSSRMLMLCSDTSYIFFVANEIAQCPDNFSSLVAFWCHTFNANRIFHYQSVTI
jgi:hypothetical protein